MGQTIEPFRSRLQPDPVAGAIAVGSACVLHLAALLLFIPAPVRNETREQTAMRFGYKGPTKYERVIRVRLLEGEIERVAKRQLMGNVRAHADRPFEGTVVPAERRGRLKPGAGGESTVPSLGEEILGKLRLRRGSLPTVQSEDLVVRTLVKPEYPSRAIEEGLEGLVELLALVNEQGNVEEVEVVRSAGAIFDDAARRAVLRWKFEPYRVSGRTQSVYAQIPVRFSLKG
jgi:TonB family protein